MERYKIIGVAKLSAALSEEIDAATVDSAKALFLRKMADRDDWPDAVLCNIEIPGVDVIPCPEDELWVLTSPTANGKAMYWDAPHGGWSTDLSLATVYKGTNKAIQEGLAVPTLNITWVTLTYANTMEGWK